MVINRKPCGVHHPKLKEIVHSNFYDFSKIKKELDGYNAAFLCLGVTSVGKKEEEYTKLTHTLTMHLAETLVSVNKDMTVCYVSGTGTDSTEKGKTMWARIKGKTENDLMNLPFTKVFPFLPGFIKPTKGLKNAHKFYKFVNWLYPLGRLIYPKAFCTLSEVGKAMINSFYLDEARKIIEGKDIIELAKK